MSISIKKQELSYLPFSDYSKLSTSKEIETLAATHGLSNFGSWMLPQLLAFWGQMELVSNDGKINGTATLQKNIGNDPHKIGIWKVCTKLARGSLVKPQNTPENCKYSALVPLVLAGVKDYQKRDYREWEDIEYCVDSKLYEAMTCEVPDISKDRWLELRAIGLSIQTGPLAGQQMGPTKRWALTGLGNTEVGHLPKLALTMLTQIWVAHPSLRHPLMVLDPRDWDTMPEPLISSEVLPAPLVRPKKVKPVEDSLDLPWLK